MAILIRSPPVLRAHRLSGVIMAHGPQYPPVGFAPVLNGRKPEINLVVTGIQARSARAGHINVRKAYGPHGQQQPAEIPAFVRRVHSTAPFHVLPNTQALVKNSNVTGFVMQAEHQERLATGTRRHLQIAAVPIKQKTEPLTAQAV